MKAAIRRAGLPCADYVTAEEGLGRDDLVARLGLPIHLKPRPTFSPTRCRAAGCTYGRSPSESASRSG